MSSLTAAMAVGPVCQSRGAICVLCVDIDALFREEKLHDSGVSHSKTSDCGLADGEDGDADAAGLVLANSVVLCLVIIILFLKPPSASLTHVVDHSVSDRIDCCCPCSAAAAADAGVPWYWQTVMMVMQTRLDWSLVPSLFRWLGPAPPASHSRRRSLDFCISD